MKNIGVLGVLILVGTGLSFAGQRYQKNGGGKYGKAFQPQSNSSAKLGGAHYSVPKYGDSAARGDHASSARRDSGATQSVVPRYNPNFTGNNLASGKAPSIAPLNPYAHVTAMAPRSTIAPLYLKSSIPGVANMSLMPTAPVDNYMRYYHPVGGGLASTGTPKVTVRGWKPRGAAHSASATAADQMAWRRKVAKNADLALREQQVKDMYAASGK